MLACAEAIARLKADAPICFVAFNCEETGYEGSRNFVEEYLPSAGYKVRHAHILEMLGYSSDAPGSQKVPTALPIELPDAGNFLGLLSDQRSGKIMDNVLGEAGTGFPGFPVLGLEVPLGMEKCLPVLARSDHVPFWERQIPAVMWTDTAEFRNPNYHKPSDTPDTLNYGFLRKATELLVSTVAGELGI
jgi:Zn-dependent M28 family amino/carboxypeptidase